MRKVKKKQQKKHKKERGKGGKKGKEQQISACNKHLANKNTPHTHKKQTGIPLKMR